MNQGRLTTILFMNEKLKPSPGFVLAEPIEDETKTSSGVYLPEVAKDKPTKAKVIAIGNDEFDDCPDINVGYTIVHKRYNAVSIKDGDKDVIFVAFEDILGYYEQDTKAG